MIFTNISWIGDFFLLWPVASGYYKETGDKIHWVLTQNYYMYPKIERLLRHQEFTEDVTLVDAGTNAWDEAEWRFNPGVYGIYGSYMNFGFTNDLLNATYMADFYASLYGLKADHEYLVQLIEFPDKIPHKKVTIEMAHQKDNLWPLWKSWMPDDVVEVNCNNPFELNIWYFAKAEERYFGQSSPPILMDLMNLPCTVFANPLFKPELFYRNRFHNLVRTRRIAKDGNGRYVVTC